MLLYAATAILTVIASLNQFVNLELNLLHNKVCKKSEGPLKLNHLGSERSFLIVEA